MATSARKVLDQFVGEREEVQGQVIHIELLMGEGHAACSMRRKREREREREKPRLLLRRDPDARLRIRGRHILRFPFSC